MGLNLSGVAPRFLLPNGLVVFALLIGQFFLGTFGLIAPRRLYPLIFISEFCSVPLVGFLNLFPCLVTFRLSLPPSALGG